MSVRPKNLQPSSPIASAISQALPQIQIMPCAKCGKDDASGAWRCTGWCEPLPKPPKEAAPIDMVMHCPECGVQHIDVPEEGTMPADFSMKPWDNPPHRSHQCRRRDGGCGHIWRPADVATNGVRAVKTKGKADSPIKGT